MIYIIGDTGAGNPIEVAWLHYWFILYAIIPHNREAVDLILVR